MSAMTYDDLYYCLQFIIDRYAGEQKPVLIQLREDDDESDMLWTDMTFFISKHIADSYITTTFPNESYQSIWQGGSGLLVRTYQECEYIDRAALTVTDQLAAMLENEAFLRENGLLDEEKMFQWLAEACKVVWQGEINNYASCYLIIGDRI